MTENESYGLRFEKKIDSIQSDIRMLSDHVTRLTFINEAHKETSEQNKKDIDTLDIKVANLENRTAAQDGGISVLRVLLGIFAGIVFSLCAWVGSSIIQLSQDQSLIKEKVSRLEEAKKMNSENTRAYLAFALVGLMFVLVIALFFVDMPRENSNLINTALGFIAGAMTTACGFLFW